MKKIIYIVLLLMVAMTTTELTYAQAAYTLKQAIVLNQGYDSSGVMVQPVTIGSYDPVAKTYLNFDTVSNAAFSSCVIIDSGYIYAAADSWLIKYDLKTKQRLAMQSVPGIREIAVWGNQLLITLGQDYPLSSYFQAYTKDSLKLIYSLPSVSGATEGIGILNDTAYVAVNYFGAGNAGELAVIDLKGQTENREINLGRSGYNPFSVEIESASNSVFTVNNLDYDSTSITKYNPANGALFTTVVNASSSCNGSTYYINNIFYQVYGDLNVPMFNTSNLSVRDSLKINKSLYGIGVDSADGYVYVGNTDYTTYGKAYIYSLPYGQAVDSFSVGINPGNFAFDVEATTGIAPVSPSFGDLEIYPNPVADQLHLTLMDSKDAQAILTLADILGREVYRGQIATNANQVVPMTSLTQGFYFLTAQTPNGELTKKIVKE